MHTTRSNGELAPKSIARHYEWAGYDVLAVTDHWQITNAGSSERVLVIPSVELSCTLPDAREGHVLAFGAIAADDSHHPGFASDLAWTWVRALELNRRAVLDALRAGTFYLSTKPFVGLLRHKL
jgi:predicted metal-dependent phosphoesterase TrpH